MIINKKQSFNRKNTRKSGDILVCVPRTSDGGGANYFNALKDLFSSQVNYFYRGRYNWPEGKGLLEGYRLIKDYFQFIIVLLKNNYKIIQINTFFGGRGLYRDAIFIALAKLLRRKTISFFRGWDMNFAHKKSIIVSIMKIIYKKSDAIIVLSKEEKDKVLAWGYKKQIYIETTTVDKDLIKAVSEQTIECKFKNSSSINILFLSRIERSKGIYEVLKVFHNLRKENKKVNLVIAGKGKHLNEVTEFVSDNKIDGVEFVGFVKNYEKSDIFNKAHVFLLPSYSEGMPNVVLEAFAFGMPVITTKVGGLRDIIKDGVNGFFVEMKNEVDLEKKINKLLLNPDLMKSIAHHNHNYAKNYFVSSVVVNRLEKIYNSVLKN